MFTPQEVQEKVFPKASGIGNGYQMSAVDEFLDTLTEDYSSLFKENMTLKAKLKVLADKIEEYRATEDSMRAALLTAQKMATKLVQEAQVEHDDLLAQARKEAADEKARLSAEVKAEEQKLALAQKNTADFIRRSSELCKAQNAFLESLPELDLVPAAEEETAADDTVTNIGQGILDSFSSQAYAAALETEAKAEDPLFTQELPAAEAPAYDDFVLSLDELKFGRNYGNYED